MKNKIPIIFLLIIISVIIFFLIMFLTIYLIKGDNIFMEKRSGNIILEKTFEVANIKDIKIAQDYGDITFERNTENNIKIIIYGKDEKNVKAELNNEKLQIENKNKRMITFFNFGNKKSEIIIYLPESYNNEIDIQGDCGNVTLPNLENAYIKVDVGAGNVEAEKVKNANIKCDMGNVEIEEILNKCDIKVKCRKCRNRKTKNK